MLDEILRTKAEEIRAAKARLPLEELRARLACHQAERSFRKAIHQPGRLSLIAELKRRSPSRGMLRERFDPVSLAQTLQEAGASALSVLTDEPHFGGHLDFLRDVKQFTEVPVLRKDFLLEPYQVYEAAWYGADAVLLIVRVLSTPQLVACLQAAEALGLDALVEVHSEGELQTAVSVGARIIGINHRNLDTFALDVRVTERLLTKLPAGKVVVAESGVQQAAEVERMQELGVHAVLIGEALMTATDVGAKVRELFAGVW